MRTAFLSIEEDQPLGICIFDSAGMSHVTLADFLDESKIDLSKVMRHKYAAAFEIMAKQLRDPP